MYDIFQMLILGFVIGLTGALAPGPTLVATINASISGNWATGLKISLGHLIVELFLVILILLGLAAVAQNHTSVIAGIGGIALILFGGLTITGSRTATMSKLTGPTCQQSLYGRIDYECSKSVFLDLVVLNRKRDGNCRVRGWTGVCWNFHGWALEC